MYLHHPLAQISGEGIPLLTSESLGGRVTVALAQLVATVGDLLSLLASLRDIGLHPPITLQALLTSKSAIRWHSMNSVHLELV